MPEKKKGIAIGITREQLDKLHMPERHVPLKPEPAVSRDPMGELIGGGQRWVKPKHIDQLLRKAAGRPEVWDGFSSSSHVPLASSQDEARLLRANLDYDRSVYEAVISDPSLASKLAKVAPKYGIEPDAVRDLKPPGGYKGFESSADAGFGQAAQIADNHKSALDGALWIAMGGEVNDANLVRMQMLFRQQGDFYASVGADAASIAAHRLSRAVGSSATDNLKELAATSYWAMGLGTPIGDHSGEFLWRASLATYPIFAHHDKMEIDPIRAERAVREQYESALSPESILVRPYVLRDAAQMISAARPGLSDAMMGVSEVLGTATDGSLSRMKTWAGWRRFQSDTQSAMERLDGAVDESERGKAAVAWQSAMGFVPFTKKEGFYASRWINPLQVVKQGPLAEFKYLVRRAADPFVESGMGFMHQTAGGAGKIVYGGLTANLELVDQGISDLDVIAPHTSMTPPPYRMGEMYDFKRLGQSLTAESEQRAIESELPLPPEGDFDSVNDKYLSWLKDIAHRSPIENDEQGLEWAKIMNSAGSIAGRGTQQIGESMKKHPGAWSSTTEIAAMTGTSVGQAGLLRAGLASKNPVIISTARSLMPFSTAQQRIHSAVGGGWLGQFHPDYIGLGVMGRAAGGRATSGLRSTIGHVVPPAAMEYDKWMELRMQDHRQGEAEELQHGSRSANTPNK